MLSIKEGFSRLVILLGPRICGDSQLIVKISRNSFTYLFVSNFNRLKLKSPVNIIFLFSFFMILNVSLTYCRKAVSLCFGCLYVNPIMTLPLVDETISIHFASNSLFFPLCCLASSSLFTYEIDS